MPPKRKVAIVIDQESLQGVKSKSNEKEKKRRKPKTKVEIQVEVSVEVQSSLGRGFGDENDMTTDLHTYIDSMTKNKSQGKRQIEKSSSKVLHKSQEKSPKKSSKKSLIKNSKKTPVKSTKKSSKKSPNQGSSKSPSYSPSKILSKSQEKSSNRRQSTSPVIVSKKKQDQIFSFQTQFDEFRKGNLPQNYQKISLICERRGISILRYFELAPKFVFAIFYHQFLKDDIINGDENFTFQDIFKVFLEKFRSTLYFDNQLADLEINIEVRFKRLIFGSLVQLSKLGKYHDHILNISQNQRVIALIYIRNHCSFHKEEIPSFAHDIINIKNFTSHTFMLQFRILLEHKVNQIIFYFIQKKYKAYSVKLTQMLCKIRHKKIAQMLQMYKQKSVDDPYFLKLINKYYCCIVEHSNLLEKQRYLLYLFLIIFSIPFNLFENKELLNYKELITHKIINRFITDRQLAFTILHVKQQLFNFGQIGSSRPLLMLFVDGILVLRSNIIQQHDSKQKDSFQRLSQFVMRLSANALKWVLSKDELNSDDLNLSILQSNSFYDQLPGNDKFSFATTSKYSPEQTAVKLLQQEILNRSGNMFRIYLLLKQIKTQQPKQARLQKELIKKIVILTKQNFLIIKFQHKINEPDAIIVQIFSQLYSLLLKYELNNYHFQVTDLHSDFFIVDEIKSAFKTSLTTTEQFMKWSRQFLTFNCKHISILNFNNLLLQNRFNKLIKKRLKPAVITEQTQILQTKTSFVEIIQSIKFEEAESKDVFLKMFYMLENSYAVFYAIAFFFGWITINFEEDKVVAILQNIYERRILTRQLPYIQELACLFGLQNMQIVFNQGKNKQTILIKQKTLEIFKQLNYETISKWFSIYQYPLQSLFYLQKTHKWEPSGAFNLNRLKRSYELHETILPDKICLSLKQIEQKTLNNTQESISVESINMIEQRILEKFFFLPQKMNSLKKIDLTSKNKNKTPEKNKSKSPNKNLKRKFNMKKSPSTRKPQKKEQQEYQKRYKPKRKLKFHKDLKIEKLTFNHLSAQLKELILLIFKLNTLEQQERTHQLIITGLMLCCYVLTPIIQKSQLCHQQNFLQLFNIGTFQNAKSLILRYLPYLKTPNHKIILLSNILLYRVQGQSPKHAQFYTILANQLFEIYLKQRMIVEATQALKLPQLNNLANRARIQFQNLNSTQLNIIFNSVNSKQKDKISLIKYLGPQDIITLYYCIAPRPDGVQLTKNAGKALDFLDKITLNQNLQYVKDKALNCFCHILGMFYYETLYHDTKALKIILENIEKWIVFCCKRQFFKNAELIGEYYVRFYVHLLLLEKNNNFQLDDFKNFYSQPVGQADSIYTLIKKCSPYFKTAYNVCMKFITTGKTKLNLILKNLLLRIAQTDVKSAQWWIFLMKYYKYADEKKLSASDIWTQQDKQIVLIGESIFKVIQKDLDNNLSNFYRGLFLILLPDNSKKLITKLQKSIELPFIRPIRIIEFTQLPSDNSSKCLTKILKVTKQNGAIANMMLKAEFTKSNLQNQCRLANLLNPLIPKQLQITYKIIQLSKYIILVQFLDNYKPLLDYRYKYQIPHNRQLLQNKVKYTGIYPPEEFTYLYNNLIPILPTYFDQLSPYIWWNKMRNYSKTTAIWSVICYVFGLGDRHGNNIMMHRQNGKIAHVDLQCSFDFGRFLGYPQYDFCRFTPNIEACLGILRYFGPFLQEMMDQFDLVNANLYHFINSIIGWNVTGKNYLKGTQDMLNQTIKRINDNEISGVMKKQKTKETALYVVTKSREPNMLKRMFLGWDPLF